MTITAKILIDELIMCYETLQDDGVDVDFRENTLRIDDVFLSLGDRSATAFCSLSTARFSVGKRSILIKWATWASSPET